MANEERALPATIGLSHFSCCAGVPREQIHVAVVGSRAVEADWAEDRAPHLLVARCHPHRAKTEPAQRRRHLRRPQALSLDTGAHALEDRQGDVLMLIVSSRIGLQRQDVLSNEVAHAAANVLDRGGQGEVHGRIRLR